MLSTPPIVSRKHALDFHTAITKEAWTLSAHGNLSPEDFCVLWDIPEKTDRHGRNRRTRGKWGSGWHVGIVTNGPVTGRTTSFLIPSNLTYRAVEEYCILRNLLLNQNSISAGDQQALHDVNLVPKHSKACSLKRQTQALALPTSGLRYSQYVHIYKLGFCFTTRRWQAYLVCIAWQ